MVNDCFKQYTLTLGLVFWGSLVMGLALYVIFGGDDVQDTWWPNIQLGSAVMWMIVSSAHKWGEW